MARVRTERDLRYPAQKLLLRLNTGEWGTKIGSLPTKFLRMLISLMMWTFSLRLFIMPSDPRPVRITDVTSAYLKFEGSLTFLSLTSLKLWRSCFFELFQLDFILLFQDSLIHPSSPTRYLGFWVGISFCV